MINETDPSDPATRQTPPPVPAPSDGGNASERDSQGVESADFAATIRTLVAAVNSGSAEMSEKLHAILRGVGLIGPEPESASERPNAGQETALRDDATHDDIWPRDREWWKQEATTRGVRASTWWGIAKDYYRSYYAQRARADAAERQKCPDPVLHDSEAIERTYMRLEDECKAANRRASSWWEAAKRLARSNRRLGTAAGNNAIERNHERRRADAAEAKLRELQRQHEISEDVARRTKEHLNRRCENLTRVRDERARVDAAEAKRLTIRTALLESELRADRAKLDAIRQAVYEGGQTDTSRCVEVRRLLPYTPGCERRTTTEHEETGQ